MVPIAETMGGKVRWWNEVVVGSGKGRSCRNDTKTEEEGVCQSGT